MSTGPSASTAASSEDEKKEQRVLHVMFLCDEWKSLKGGLSTFNREFVINLAEITTGSMKIYCYVSKSDDRDREDAKKHGVNLINAETLPGSRDPLDWLKVPPPELQHPHVVIGHGRKLGTPACHIVRAAKCKWIQFVHVFCEDLGKYKKTTTAAVDTIEENEDKHKMEIELCKAADAVVAVGSRLQQKYSRSLLNVKVEIITPGIFGKFSNESKLAVDRAVVKHFNVSMFGRATFEDRSLKGYDIVANAIGPLGKNFELTFVGSSPGEYRKVEQWFLDNTGISRNQLTIRGYCSDTEELKMMFYQSDLVALPSRTEGFGLVALEAISAGIPILVSGESGIAEALRKVEGGNAVIVELDEDADEWGRKITEMAEESAEEREAKARRLRENYRKVYSWRAECERFKGTIEKVVKSANGGELNIKVDVKDVEPEERNTDMRTSILWTTESVGQEAQEPGTSTASATVRSVCYPQKEYLAALKEQIFLSIVQNYLQTTPPQSTEEHNMFKEYAKDMRFIITGVSVGSLVITVKCESQLILVRLLIDYLSGHLGEVVQNSFVTEKILKKLNLAMLRLETTMDMEEYNACEVYFERVALRDVLSAHSYFKSTEDEAQLERWKQKTEVVESEKVKSTWPLPGSSTSDPEEELEKLHWKLQGMEELEGRLETFTLQEEIPAGCTLLSPALYAAGHEKELEGRLKTFTLQEEKGILSPSEEELEELLMKLQSMKDTSLSTKLSTAGHGKELEGKLKTMTLQEEKRSLPSSPLSTTDLEEKLEKVCVKLMRLRKKGSLAVPESSTSHLVKKLAELCMELIRLRMEGTLPPPELFTVDLEEELVEVGKLGVKLFTQRYEVILSMGIFQGDVIELLRQLQGKRTEALEFTMYPTIISGLGKFDVSLPEELQSYVSYLFNESAKLGLRKRAIHSLSSVEELREAMDEDQFERFLSIHIREGAWQVALLFMDELPSYKLPWDWFVDAPYLLKEEEKTIGSLLYSSTSGILKAWPTKYDPDLVTLCKAITDRDWKVTGLILCRSRTSKGVLKNLSTALTQGELYSLALCDSHLQSRGLKHLFKALISGDCKLTSLNVSRNWLGDEDIIYLFTVLTNSNCTLTRLNVRSNRAGDRAVKDLARALTNKNCALTSLDISWNQIGDEGIKYLCKALTDPNCKLRSLDLSGNWKVTDVGKQCLSEAITGTDWEVRKGLTLSRFIKSEA